MGPARQLVCEVRCGEREQGEVVEPMGGAQGLLGDRLRHAAEAVRVRPEVRRRQRGEARRDDLAEIRVAGRGRQAKLSLGLELDFGRPAVPAAGDYDAVVERITERLALKRHAFNRGRRESLRLAADQQSRQIAGGHLRFIGGAGVSGDFRRRGHLNREFPAPSLR